MIKKKSVAHRAALLRAKRGALIEQTIHELEALDGALKICLKQMRSLRLARDALGAELSSKRATGRARRGVVARMKEAVK
ncbi:MULTISPECIES: hypothetical protein [Bradyrhizobium]|uniref:hypothetical protein n=1 Tax=Bradyrhizobium TaxID=374 RepID=UPI001EDA8945|nr:hypothetical protein [Bradyrhizobium zhengyangense]MCG2645576.1 hypothetical protein [Bradyrhizobium zhengyangense]